MPKDKDQDKDPRLEAEVRLAMAIEGVAAATVSRMRPVGYGPRTFERIQEQNRRTRTRLIDAIGDVIAASKPVERPIVNQVGTGELHFQNADGGYENLGSFTAAQAGIPKLEVPTLGKPMTNLFPDYTIEPTEIATVYRREPSIKKADVLYRGCVVGRVAEVREHGSHRFRGLRSAPRMTDYSLGVFDNFDSAVAQVIASAGRS